MRSELFEFDNQPSSILGYKPCLIWKIRDDCRIEIFWQSLGHIYGSLICRVITDITDIPSTLSYECRTLGMTENDIEVGIEWLAETAEGYMKDMEVLNSHVREKRMSVS